MVIDAPPAAVGVDGNGDIGRTAVGNKVAGRTVAGLVDKACFGREHGATGLFILYAAQKPVGDQQSFGMLLGDAGGISAGRQHLPAPVVFQRRL